MITVAEHAMATEFRILLPDDAGAHGKLAAAEALRELEKLEAELSRFRPSSDIARLNALDDGESILLCESAIDCIALAIDVHAATDGAFDISVAPLLSIYRGEHGEPRAPSESEIARAKAACGMDKVELDAAARRATARGEERWFDLGGIGKGYALDQMAAKLRELEVENALLDAGGSTLLGFGEGPDGDGWPTGTGVPGAPAFTLRDRALSGSGFSEQGEHVIDPRRGVPVTAAKFNAWALAPGAALADALSTAFLVMEEAEIEALCSAHPDIGAVLPEFDAADGGPGGA